MSTLPALKDGDSGVLDVTMIPWEHPSEKSGLPLVQRDVNACGGAVSPGKPGGAPVKQEAPGVSLVSGCSTRSDAPGAGRQYRENQAVASPPRISAATHPALLPALKDRASAPDSSVNSRVKGFSRIEPDVPTSMTGSRGRFAAESAGGANVPPPGRALWWAGVPVWRRWQARRPARAGSRTARGTARVYRQADRQLPRADRKARPPGRAENRAG